MIRLMAAGDEARLLAAAQSAPCIGARLEVDWRLLCENPRMPYRFYLDENGAALELSARGAVLCGAPANGEETALFLRHAGAARLLSTGWAPAGWHASAFVVMAREPKPWEGGEALAPGPLPTADGRAAPYCLAPAPNAEEVLAVLESSTGRIAPESARDGFYADLCARRAHGYAEVVGIYTGAGTEAGAAHTASGESGRANADEADAAQQLAATAGIYALTQTEAYLACVETRGPERGRGLATALVRHLCAKYAHRRVTLMCEEALMPFYQRLGFGRLTAKACLATPHSANQEGIITS